MPLSSMATVSAATLDASRLEPARVELRGSCYTAVLSNRALAPPSQLEKVRTGRLPGMLAAAALSVHQDTCAAVPVPPGLGVAAKFSGQVRHEVEPVSSSMPIVAEASPAGGPAPAERTFAEADMVVQPPPGLPPPAGLPSHGSVLHTVNGCRPCAWFWKETGCQNGEDCWHCHLCPESVLKDRKRIKRSLKARAAAVLKQAEHLPQVPAVAAAGLCLPQITAVPPVEACTASLLLVRSRCGSECETAVGSSSASVKSLEEIDDCWP